LSTLYGETRARLADKNHGNHVIFQVSLNFFALFVLFRKTVVSTHKTVDNKAPDQILPFSDNTHFRNKAVNSGHSRAAQRHCSENPFVEKRNQYHTCCLEFCTGRFVTSAPWESTLRNNLNKGTNLIHPFIHIIPQGADVTNRPVQNSKTACVILICFFNKAASEQFDKSQAFLFQRLKYLSNRMLLSS